MKRMDNISPSKKKKILLISYHFPPSTAVGGLRVAYFAKYLPLFGWNTYVLTIKNKYLTKLDGERIKDIDVQGIFRTSKLPTVIGIYLRIKKLYFSILNRRLVTQEELEKVYMKSSGNYSGSEKLFQKLKRYLISFLALPDMERNWVLPAVFRAVREIRRENIDCILTSSPPYSVHLIGLLVNPITGVKWVADFRDPWVTPDPKRLYITCDLSNKMEKWLEKKVIQKADMVLTTTEMLSNAFSKIFKTRSSNKFVYISNGFDAESFSRMQHLHKYEIFTLSYTGTLYLGRSPEPVFQAIRDLDQEGRINLEGIKIKLVGNCQHVDGYPISQLIDAYGLHGVVELLESVPYLKALEIIKKSHVALLFAPGQPYQIPAKVYDYIGLGTKILALTEEGATRDLILSTGTGSAVEPTDVHGIKEFILNALTNDNAPVEVEFCENSRSFDRRLLTKKLADHMNGIM